MIRILVYNAECSMLDIISVVVYVKLNDKNCCDNAKYSVFDII